MEYQQSILGNAMCDSERKTLPTRRRCITQKVKIGNSRGKQSVHYTIGLYDDGMPGELFVDVAKAGAALRDWAGQAAMLFSVALQHGSPLLTVLNLFIGSKSDPHGDVEGHPYINRCLSIMDLITRDIAITFLNRYDLADIEGCNKPMLLETYRSNCLESTCKGNTNGGW